MSTFKKCDLKKIDKSVTDTVQRTNKPLFLIGHGKQGAYEMEMTVNAGVDRGFKANWLSSEQSACVSRSARYQNAHRGIQLFIH